MFRRFRKLVWPHRERLLSLVMLPAFVLATLPNTACICADGHREPRCKAAACQALADGLDTAACCGCSCCEDRATHAGRSCCQAKHAQATEAVSKPLPGLTAAASTCCQRIVEVPAPATAGAKVNATSKQSLLALEAVAPPLELGTNARPTFTRIDFTAPPLDVVIVFQRLTI